jgi:hypothetical protein
MTGLSDDVDVGADVGEFNELLVIKDDLSHYTELFPAKTPTAEAAASALLDWFTRFGVPSTIVSDTASHFKNQVLEILVERMAAHHHFTLPHCPWSNGTIERANFDVLQVFRALLSEYRLLPRQWLQLKPVVQMSINHTLVTTLGGKAPITVFTGLPASNPLDIVFLPPKAFSATRLTAERIAELTENLRTSLQAIHKTVVRTRSSDDVGDVGDVDVDATDVRPPKGVDVNFDVGDYVLWAKDVSTHKQHQDKLHATWYGPMRVTAAVTPWIYEIEDLLSGTKYKAHTRRLKYYIDSSLNITEEVKEQLRHDNGQWEVSAFLARRCVNKRKHKWEILVQWTGYEGGGENTWEPVLQLYQDVPILVKRYLRDVDVPADVVSITTSLTKMYPTFSLST